MQCSVLSLIIKNDVEVMKTILVAITDKQSLLSFKYGHADLLWTAISCPAPKYHQPQQEESAGHWENVKRHSIPMNNC